MPSPPESYKTPKENFALLQTCSNVPQARAFLAGLSKRELMELHAVNTNLELGVIIYPNASPEKQAEFPKPSQQHADQLYRSLFTMVESALETAHSEGKKLHVVVADIHFDRTALLPMAMLVHICHRLDIADLGIEVSEEGRDVFHNGAEKLGLKELQRKILLQPKGGVLSEFGDSGTITGQRRNFDFLTQLGMEQKMSLFANDPEFMRPDFINPDTGMKDRNINMRYTLGKKGDCISMYGVLHLDPLKEPATDKAHNLLINTANIFFNGKEEMPTPVMEGFTILPDDPEQAARIGRGHRDGSSPVVQILVDGQLQLARDALHMAKQADINVGEELAPLSSLTKGHQR